jgi:hypothetical protein
MDGHENQISLILIDKVAVTSRSLYSTVVGVKVGQNYSADVDGALSPL